MSYPFDPLEPSGSVFNYPFSAAALTTAGPNDLFCITAPSNSRVVVREIRLGQYSEFGDAQAELLSLTLMTGSTAIGGGTVIAGYNVQRHSGAPTAGSSVTGPSTTIASTTSASLALADSYNVAAGWYYKPPLKERIVLEPSTRLILRQSTPNDAITINGTLVLQEIGSKATT